MQILPLAASDQYRALRQLSGGDTFLFDPRPGSLVDFRLSVGQKVALSFHVGGDVLLREMVELLIRWEEGGVKNPREEYDRLFWKLPVGVGLHAGMAEGKVGAEELVNLLKGVPLLKGEPSDSRYREVKIHKLPIDPEKYRQIAAFASVAVQQQEVPLAAILSLLPTQEAPSALYIASINGAVQVTASEAFLKKQIDQAQAPKKGGDKKPAEAPREANAAFSLNPNSAQEGTSLYLQYEGHSLALLNNQVWNCFHQTGLLAPDASEAVSRATARRFLGYVPVSADGSTYRHDARWGEVINTRHGSHRQPQLQARLAEGSELARFLDQIRGLRAELRFLENGLHTVLTIDRR
jgi:hypothetical protein